MKDFFVQKFGFKEIEVVNVIFHARKVTAPFSRKLLGSNPNIHWKFPTKVPKTAETTYPIKQAKGIKVNVLKNSIKFLLKTEIFFLILDRLSMY